jgi:segregation and condensation protein A
VTTPTEAAVLETTQQPAGDAPSGFSVRVGEFEGPFDLLLTLISKHKLEVTELALHQVTDEFIGYIRGQGTTWDLDEASGFLVVAATLLDLKAARLLPSGEVEDEEDLALLEARDLLFARLLQYRAYKEVSALFAERMAGAAKRFPRTVGLEPKFAALLPEVLIGLGPEQFAAMAARALAPKPIEVVSTAHIHVQRVSVREQAAIIVDRLRRHRTTTFRALIADCDTTLLVIGRFLALLELYREQVVAFEQITPLGDLTIRWTGTDEGDIAVTDEFDIERDVDRADQASDGPEANEDETAAAVEEETSHE